MIMPREVELLGATFPALVPAFLIAGIIMLALDRIFAISGLYRRVWHPSLFRFALFVSLFSGMGLVIY